MIEYLFILKIHLLTSSFENSALRFQQYLTRKEIKMFSVNCSVITIICLYMSFIACEPNLRQEDDVIQDDLRTSISDWAEGMKKNLLNPGFTVLVSGFTLWSIMNIMVSTIGLLTNTENMRTNILSVLHEFLLGYVTNGVAGAFITNVGAPVNPVLSALSSLTKPKPDLTTNLHLRRRRDVDELIMAAQEAFNKYSDLQN